MSQLRITANLEQFITGSAHLIKGQKICINNGNKTKLLHG